jgi:hypothetical protein
VNTFYLKYRDTLPVLEVVLLDPDGTAHDLTGSTAWKLHVRIEAQVFTRDMVPDADRALGILRYTWAATDWTLGTPTLQAGHWQMEYEVLGPGSQRKSWPNDGYDRLSAIADIGQG